MRSKNAGEFAAPIEDIGKLLVPSITLTEVFKCVMRQRDGKRLFECANGHKVSLTAGTILHGTHQDLLTWFYR